MAAVITYPLPTVLLVCCLVATGNSNPIDTNSGAIEATSQSPSFALPTGYKVYSNFSVAYKIHREPLSWSRARDACIQEGAHLADIDSYEKTSASWMKLESLTYTEIHFANGAWRSAHTGLPVANIAWDEREPWIIGGTGGCALMKYFHLGGHANTFARFRILKGNRQIRLEHHLQCRSDFLPMEPVSTQNNTFYHHRTVTSYAFLVHCTISY